MLGVDWNHLAHLGAVVRLLLVKLLDDKLATAARAVEHLWSTHHTVDFSSGSRTHHTLASSALSELDSCIWGWLLAGRRREVL